MVSTPFIIEADQIGADFLVFHRFQLLGFVWFK